MLQKNTGHVFSCVGHSSTSGRGVLTLPWYTNMCLPFGVLFPEIWYSEQRIFIRDEGTQITINLVYFGQIIVKSTQFGQNLVLFLLKMVYWWVGNWTKNWYRESQIFKVWQAYPGMILLRVHMHDLIFSKYTGLVFWGVRVW